MPGGVSRFAERFGVPRRQVAQRAGLHNNTMALWDAGLTRPTLGSLLAVHAALIQLGRPTTIDELADYYHIEGERDERNAGCVHRLGDGRVAGDAR